jgi:hypothetical protein
MDRRAVGRGGRLGDHGGHAGGVNRMTLPSVTSRPAAAASRMSWSASGRPARRAARPWAAWPGRRPATSRAPRSAGRRPGPAAGHGCAAEGVPAATRPRSGRRTRRPTPARGRDSARVRVQLAGRAGRQRVQVEQLGQVGRLQRGTAISVTGGGASDAARSGRPPATP